MNININKEKELYLKILNFVTNQQNKLNECGISCPFSIQIRKGEFICKLFLKELKTETISSDDGIEEIFFKLKDCKEFFN